MFAEALDALDTCLYGDNMLQKSPFSTQILDQPTCKALVTATSTMVFPPKVPKHKVT